MEEADRGSRRKGNGYPARHAGGSLAGRPNRERCAGRAAAHDLLAYHDVAVHAESGCDPPDSAAELCVYPPDQGSAPDKTFTSGACSHDGPVWMSLIEPIIPTVRTIHGEASHAASRVLPGPRECAISAGGPTTLSWWPDLTS